MSTKITAVVATLVCASALAACGGGGDSKAAPKVTNTTAPPATAATPLTGHPLTGQPGEVKQRPALVVKIDNAPKAIPQAGLAFADVVVEEAVEGGVTRFMVIFHSQDTDEVGPVRSARSTDITVATALNRPLFSYSGANAVFERLLRESTLQNVGPSTKAGAYFRKPGRPAPYNYWGRFPQIYEGATGAPPTPMFAYRAAGQEPSTVAEVFTGGVKFEFRGRIVTAVEWRFDPATNTYRRQNNGAEHKDANGTPVQPVNLVVQFTEYENTGLVDASGEPVPEGKIIGEGEVWVFTDGKLVKGRWKKDSAEAPIVYTDSTGQPIKLTPGQTWLELPKPGSATLL